MLNMQSTHIIRIVLGTFTEILVDPAANFESAAMDFSPFTVRYRFFVQSYRNLERVNDLD